MSARDARSRVHDRVISQLGDTQLDERALDELVHTAVREHFPLINSIDATSLVADIVHDVTGYGFIEDLLTDEEVNEIMINSSTCAYVDRSGVMENTEITTTNDELIRLGQKIAGSVGARFDTSSPILDAWLRDGSRVHAVMPPVSPDGVCITIRRFITRSFDLDQFCDSENHKQIICNIVEASRNIVVAGGTSSGKTTLLNCLIHHVDHAQRIISIEETAELQTDHPHWVRLLARTSNSEGVGEIPLGELVKTSLRMRPDRIIVGEVRSGEAFDLIQALNTGHDGSLCTIHANGPDEVIHRMASLAMFAHPGLQYDALLTQIAFGIDIIVFVKRSREGKRRIDSISEVRRNDNGCEVVRIDGADGAHV